MIPLWLQAGFWGLVGGSALLIGATISYSAKVPQRMIAAIMAFGAGVLISALSNIPEGLSSAAGMKQGGRSLRYVFGVWGGIAFISGLAALLGYAVFSHFSKEVIAATMAVAAGAILAMLSDTMIPEAFENVHNFAGLITVLGFLTAFILSKL